MSKNTSVALFGALRRADARHKNITRRVREPVSPSKGRVVGYYASKKVNRPVAWESQLELKACMRLEFSPAVLTYHEQPATLHFPALGRMCKYTPDFEVETRAGDVFFIEVKPFSKVGSPKVRPLLKAASDFLEERGYGYAVLTERELVHPELLRNLTILKPYLWQKLERAEVSTLKSWLSENGTVNLSTLVEATGSLKKAYSFIAHGHAVAALDAPISPDTEINQIPENHHETCLFKGRFAPDFA